MRGPIEAGLPATEFLKGKECRAVPQVERREERAHAVVPRLQPRSLFLRKGRSFHVESEEVEATLSGGRQVGVQTHGRRIRLGVTGPP